MTQTMMVAMKNYICILYCIYINNPPSIPEKIVEPTNFQVHDL